MKIKTLSTFALFSLLCASLYFGCKKDNPKKYTNENYVGTWDVSSKGNVTTTFKMTIAASGSDGLTITNFHGSFPVTATVSKDALTMAAQNSTSSSVGGPYKFSGTGTLNSASSLSIAYTVADVSGANAVNWTATCTK